MELMFIKFFISSFHYLPSCWSWAKCFVVWCLNEQHSSDVNSPMPSELHVYSFVSSARSVNRRRRVSPADRQKPWKFNIPVKFVCTSDRWRKIAYISRTRTNSLRVSYTAWSFTICFESELNIRTAISCWICLIQQVARRRRLKNFAAYLMPVSLLVARRTVPKLPLRNERKMG